MTDFSFDFYRPVLRLDQRSVGDNDRWFSKTLLLPSFVGPARPAAYPCFAEKENDNIRGIIILESCENKGAARPAASD